MPRAHHHRSILINNYPLFVSPISSGSCMRWRKSWDFFVGGNVKGKQIPSQIALFPPEISLEETKTKKITLEMLQLKDRFYLSNITSFFLNLKRPKNVKIYLYVFHSSKILFGFAESNNHILTHEDTQTLQDHDILLTNAF